jgi:FMN phosphatase YigB (HAD superfamily)
MRDKMLTQTIIFIDLDNTVMINPFRSKIFPYVCKKISSQTDRNPLEILNLIYEEHARRKADPTMVPRRVMDWDEIVKEVSIRLGTTWTIPLEKLVTRYAHFPYIRIIDNADKVLTKLALPGRRRIVAITNGLSKYQLPVLKSLGLLQHFDELLSPDKTNHLKSEKEFYITCLVKQSSPLLSIVVGDDYFDDVFYPKQFGFFSVWVLREDGNSGVLLKKDAFQRAKEIITPQGFLIKPDAVIGNLSFLPKVIDRIEKLWCAKSFTDTT